MCKDLHSSKEDSVFSSIPSISTIRPDFELSSSLTQFFQFLLFDQVLVVCGSSHSRCSNGALSCFTHCLMGICANCRTHTTDKNSRGKSTLHTRNHSHFLSLKERCDNHSSPLPMKNGCAQFHLLHVVGNPTVDSFSNPLDSFLKRLYVRS